MIQNLTISDLNAILIHLREKNSSLWYKLEMNSNNELSNDELTTELHRNEGLITAIENEINSRIFDLKK